MCDVDSKEPMQFSGARTIPVGEAVGTVLAHDITEIRPGDFKGRAFKKGHVIRGEDVSHLRRLGKERLFVLSLGPDDIHEDEAAQALAAALLGDGVEIEGEPCEGKVNIIACRAGLLKVNAGALLELNMLGEVMCATRHGNTLVKKGRSVAGARAIPLVVKRALVDHAVAVGVKAREAGSPVLEVKEIRRPRAGVVITGNEVYHGRIKDAFAPVIAKKIEEFGGELVGVYYAPDDKSFIVDRLRELLNAGADLLITTGGMSVDPDDVTRFAIRELGAADITYGSAVLPGAMVLVGYLEKQRNGETGKRGNGEKDFRKETTLADSPVHRFPDSSPSSGNIPILGIPACSMYHKITALDLILPRVLAGERIGRKELAELGHGGLCLHCKTCRYPVCPFGK